MKVGIVGSRSFENYELFSEVISEILKEGDIIISGGAKGADSLARKYADEHNFDYAEFLPDWKTFGKIAGFMRNSEIVNQSDYIVAFWNGKSKGTKDTIDKAHKKGINVIIINLQSNYL